MIPIPKTPKSSSYSWISCLLIFLMLVACKSKPIYDPLDQQIDIGQAKEDFRVYRQILESGHPGLTEYITPKRKNSLLDSLDATITKSLSYRDYFKKLAFFAGNLGCSHTIMTLPPFISDTLYHRKVFFPFPVILLDNDLYVNTDRDIAHGTKILSINGIPTSRILDSLMIYNAIEGYPRITQRYASASEFSYNYYVHFGVPKKFDLLLKTPGGSTKNSLFDPITLTELQERETARFYYDPTDIDFALTINENLNYALIRLPSFDLGTYGNKQTAFENFVRNTFDLLSTKPEITNLILDIRENGGGTLYNSFLLHSYLCKDSFPEYKSVFSRAKKIPLQQYLYDDGEEVDVRYINQKLKKDFVTREDLGFNIPDSLIDKWAPNPKRFRGNVYIITNHKVCSAASYFTLLTKNNGRAKVVGTETCGGAYSGNGFRMLEFKLPQSKIRLRFPYAKMIYSFGDPKTGRGIVPDYPCADDYESFKYGQDKQLNFIIDSLISKNR